MTQVTHYEWLTLPYPSIGTGPAAAGTVQQCADGKTFVVWDNALGQFQVWRNGAWGPQLDLPVEPSTGLRVVPVAFSSPYYERMTLLTLDVGAFGTQRLWTVHLDGSPYFRSFDVSTMEFPADHSSAGPYHLWNNGKQAIFQFPDMPERVWLAYQDFTGKSLMAGWFSGDVTVPIEVISFTDTQVSIQLLQQGSQKAGPTIFGDPLPIMGFPPGWMFNKDVGHIAPPNAGCRVFAKADGWPVATYPNVITFGADSWQVSYRAFPGSLFNRDAIPAGLPGYAIGQGAGLYPGGRNITLGNRSWAQFNPGGPLASVGYYPYDPNTQLIGLPLLAGPPAGLSANWHGALLQEVPYLLDDAGHWVYLGLVTFILDLQDCVNFCMFATLKGAS